MRFLWAIFFLLLAVGAPAQDAPPPAPAEAPAPAAPPQPAAIEIPQVQIQVWISEMTENGLRDLGANLFYTRFVRGNETAGSVQQVNTNVHDLEDESFTVSLPAPDETLFGTPMRPDASGTITDGIQTQEGVGGTFTLIESGYGTIEGAFRALEQKSDVDLLSKPEILVISGELATIHAGGEVPYQKAGYEKGVAKTNVEWQKIGVNMEITPTIGADDDMIKIHIQKLDVSEISRVDQIRGLDLPVLSTRSQTGDVLVPNGGTLMIGGLSSRVVRRTERRVPLIGRVPLLGMPFRGRQTEATENHLLVFVSPTSIDLTKLDEDTQALEAIEFWKTEEYRHLDEINEEVQLLQDEPL